MDATVQFLLENLGHLLQSNIELILNVREQVQFLNKELRLFKALLKDSSDDHRNAYLNELERQLKDALYEAEDAVEIFVTYTAVQKARGRLERIFHGFDYASKLLSLAKDIESIRTQMKEKESIRMKMKENYGTEVISRLQQFRPESERRLEDIEKAPNADEDYVVGFEDEVDKVIKLLTGGSKELEVISIAGMPGLGKTTLAKMILRDPRMREEFKFNYFALVHISQNFSRNKALLEIIGQLAKRTADMRERTDGDLAQEVWKILRNGKYLIVLDDVWENNVLDYLIKSAFPDNKTQSRILLTSRMEHVANYANPKRDPHHLRYFTTEESRKLLLQKALGSEECFDDDLARLGERIAESCKGLPLAVVVIGGILREKGAKYYWWEKVADNVDEYLSLDRQRRMEEIVAMSFDILPYHLKACFLYFGMLSENFQISVSKLVRLWIAEGLIEKPEVSSLEIEETAENYLEELITWNLVEVEVRRSNGRIKICRVHDMLRDFCKKKAVEEFSFCEVKDNQGTNSSWNSLSERYRRLGIHSRALNNISFEPYGPYVRSLLFFFPEKITTQFKLGNSNIPEQFELQNSIPEAFKLLRVLEGQSIKFNQFPNDLTQLIHLRYLHIYIDLSTLPAEISDLLNMQTLTVATSSLTFEIRADIWKLIKLRHLKIYASTSLQGPLTKTKKSKPSWLPSMLVKPKKSRKVSAINGNLQTLSTISPESCTPDVFATVPNLKKLGIRGKLSKLLEVKGGSTLFDSLVNLSNLGILKLWNDVSPKLESLPQSYKFPPNLKKLTLSGTRLHWKYMSTLGQLEKLDILKLKDNAFKGERWDHPVEGFAVLKVLHIETTDLVYWDDSAGHFPQLRRLYLKHCNMLTQVSFSLAGIRNLHLVHLYNTNLAVASARRIQQHKLQNQDEQTTRGSGFELIIDHQDE